MSTTILTLIGSLREGSINRRLAEAAAAHAPESVDVVTFDALNDIPFYNEDIDNDADRPQAADALRAAAADADAVLLVSPEYNGSMPAVLKNAIDWLSRPYGQGAIVGKPFAAIGATPTPYGGKWSHEHARHSATIAGAVVVEGIVVDESAVAGDPLEDEAAVQRFLGALDALVAHEVEAAA